jgi:nucleoid DNA-binding protein
MEVYILNNKSVITKENLINIILDKCEDDFISTEDLIKLIDKSTDENGAISKKKLIKSIKNVHTKTVIKNVYNIFEDVVFEELSSVSKKQDVCIRLFEGISLDGKYISEKTKKNNLTGETSFVASKIKPKFNITRSYCEKLNNK